MYLAMVSSASGLEMEKVAPQGCSSKRQRSLGISEGLRFKESLGAPQTGDQAAAMNRLATRLAVTSRYKTQSGEDKEDTVFVDVNVWGRTAENCAQYLSKGSPALVEGRLKLDQWEKDGKKNSKLFVVADRVQFIGAPKGGAEVSDQPPTQRSAPRPVSKPAPKPAAAAEEDVAPPAGDGDDNIPF